MKRLQLATQQKPEDIGHDIHPYYTPLILATRHHLQYTGANRTHRTDDTGPNAPFTGYEMERALPAIKRNTTPGADEIAYKMIKKPP